MLCKCYGNAIYSSNVFEHVTVASRSVGSGGASVLLSNDTTSHRSHLVALGETLPDHRGEAADRLLPLCTEARLEALEKSAEHAVQLGRGVLPLADGVAEPHEALGFSTAQSAVIREDSPSRYQRGWR